MKVSEQFELNKEFNPKRNKKPEFGSLTYEEQLELIQAEPLYGNVICKCERITEKEVLDAINGPLGSNTIKGVKKRCRAGAGLCQGGYCEEKVYKLIVRETNSTPLDVCYDGAKSKMFVSETKVKK
jgi:glycerol-3-phosphate dehydrogenase